MLRNPRFLARIEKITSDESEAWKTLATILVHTGYITGCNTQAGASPRSRWRQAPGTRRKIY
jgi:hypothetical protein